MVYRLNNFYVEGRKQNEIKNSYSFRNSGMQSERTFCITHCSCEDKCNCEQYDPCTCQGHINDPCPCLGD